MTYNTTQLIDFSVIFSGRGGEEGKGQLDFVQEPQSQIRPNRGFFQISKSIALYWVALSVMQAPGKSQGLRHGEIPGALPLGNPVAPSALCRQACPNRPTDNSTQSGGLDFEFRRMCPLLVGVACVVREIFMTVPSLPSRQAQ